MLFGVHFASVSAYEGFETPESLVPLMPLSSPRKSDGADCMDTWQHVEEGCLVPRCTGDAALHPHWGWVLIAARTFADLQDEVLADPSSGQQQRRLLP